MRRSCREDARARGALRCARTREASRRNPSHSVLSSPRCACIGFCPSSRFSTPPYMQSTTGSGRRPPWCARKALPDLLLLTLQKSTRPQHTPCSFVDALAVCLCQSSPGLELVEHLQARKFVNSITRKTRPCGVPAACSRATLPAPLRAPLPQPPLSNKPSQVRHQRHAHPGDCRRDGVQRPPRRGVQIRQHRRLLDGEAQP